MHDKIINAPPEETDVRSRRGLLLGGVGVAALAVASLAPTPALPANNVGSLKPQNNLLDLNDYQSAIVNIGAMPKVATRTALAAVDQTRTTFAWLAESQREGVFQFDSSNLSARVTADTQQGIYVAPASAPTGASGAWVRQFDGPVYPAWFGATTASLDNKVQLECAFALAVLVKQALIVPTDTAYTISTLVIPNTATMVGDGTIVSDASLSGSTVTVTIGDDVTIETLKITTPGTETNTDIVSLGARFTCGLLSIVSSAQRAGGGITCAANNVRIEYVLTRNIDRPLHLLNQGTVSQTTGNVIGFLDCINYVRGFRADFCSFEVGGMWVRGRSPNAAKTPGHNGVLIQGCADWQFGNCRIDNAGEHAFRVGGSPGSWALTQNYSVGVIYAVRPGGCALKINPTRLVSAGVTEKCYNGSIVGVVGVDVGDNVLGGNSELLRLTHAFGLQIGYAVSMVDDYAVSSQYFAQINDCHGVWINSLGGYTAPAGFISIDGTSDADGVATFGGNIIDFSVGRLFGTVNGNNGIGVSTLFSISGVNIVCDDVNGFATNLLLWSAGTLTGTFQLGGRVSGAVSPAISGAPAGTSFVVNLSYNNARAMGTGALSRIGSALEVVANLFAATDQPPTGLTVNSGLATAASGGFGGALEFTRLGSSRRAAAIVPRQATADEKEVGLSVFVGDSASTASEVVIEAARFTYQRTFAIVDGVSSPTVMAGWGQLFIDTADGDLKIMFGDGTVKTIVVDT